jgi:UDP-N-acetylglucosamine--N-acetylmuramyl-(pentapeptide) pyrophosphoryl-undecaprenol N-acetylglucosamine transferase
MLAVGEALRKLAPEAEVLYVGTARGLEARAIPAAGEELALLDVAPLRGGGLAGFARGLGKAFGSLPAARALVKRRKPDVVLSVGGYAGGPVALAARLMGVPLAILEPNSTLGLTNKLLAPLAKRAYVAFGDLDRRFGPEVGARFGVPLRKSFEPVPYAPEAGRFRVLVLGGSQGAKGLNDAMPEAMAKVVSEVDGAEILHQAGRGRDVELRDRYAALGLGERARVVDFVTEVGAELARADVVVQRAGASSLAELCLVARPSILVPFPFAADDHQAKNAASLEAEGASVCVLQRDATSERLAELLLELARDPARRVAMAEAARRCATPTAAEDVARDLIALAGAKGAGRGMARGDAAHSERQV